MKKIPSFTLVEITIVMLISSIVIALCFTMYEIVKKDYIRKSNQQEINYSLLHLSEALTNDFENAQSIYFHANNLTFHKEKENILYKFKQENIIRKNAFSADTFYFAHEDLLVKQLKNHNNLVNALQFTINFEKIVFPYNFSKEYAHKTLFYLNKKDNGN